jgi:hypothetical protein
LLCAVADVNERLFYALYYVFSHSQY